MKKKGKSNPVEGTLGGYEEDLDAGELNDPDLAAALKASKEEAKNSGPKPMKKNKSAPLDP